MSSRAYTPEENKSKSFFLLIGDFLSFFKDLYQESPHIFKSLFVHLIILLALSGFIPSCSKKIESPKLISVDIMPLSNSDKQDKKKALPKPEEVKKKKKVKKEIKKIVKTKKPKVKKKQVARELKKKKEFIQKSEKLDKKKQEVVVKKKAKLPPIEKPKNNKKTELKTTKKQKPNEKDDKAEQEGKKSLLKDVEQKESLDDIFNSIQAEEKTKATAPKKAKVEVAKNDNFIPDAEFVSEIEGKIRDQVQKCWAIPAGAKNVGSMVVPVYIKMDAGGYVRKVDIVDKSRYNSDNFYRVLADSAVWAVRECSPFQALPADKHEFWEEVEFNFDPSNIL